MLQLILGILKVIGILLLAVFLLLLLAVLALLFVPVRYEAAGKKKKGALAARIKISWLFRLLSLQAVYLEGKIQIRLRLFGVTLKKVGWGGERTENTKRRAGRREPPGFEESEWEEEEPEEPGEKIPAILPEETSSSRPKTSSSERTETENRPEPDHPALAGKEPGTDQASGRMKRTGLLPRFARTVADMFRKLGRAAANILDFILYLPQRILDGAEKLGQLISSVGHLLEELSARKEEWTEKLEPFLEPEAKALYKRLFGHIKYLLKHYGPGKIKGWIRLGTGMPDVTAQLSGLIYFLLPVTADEFEVRPDFSEAILEGDVLMKGHVRSCCLAKVAFLLWRDKEFREMLRRVKGGI